jgi:hypothetical protein
MNGFLYDGLGRFRHFGSDLGLQKRGHLSVLGTFYDTKFSQYFCIGVFMIYKILNGYL